MGQHSDCPACSGAKGCQCGDKCECLAEACQCCPSAAGQRCGPCSRFKADENCSCADGCDCGTACVCCAATSKAGAAARAKAAA